MPAGRKPSTIEHPTTDAKALLAHRNRTLLASLDRYASVSMTDHLGAIIQVNDAFCALSGYSRRELLGRDHRVLNSGTHAPEFWQQLWQAICAGQDWRGVVCNRSKTGTLYWVDSMISPVHDDAGSIAGFNCINIDITALQQTQRQLTEAEAFLTRAAAVTGVGAFCLDLRTYQQKWTAQCFRIFDMEGETAPSFKDTHRLHATTASREQLEEAIATAIATGRNYEIEIPMLTAHGRPIWVSAVASVEFDNGEAARLVGAFQDVTERRLAAETLRITNERLTLATEAAGMGIWEWDLVTNDLHWDDNVYRLHGYLPGQDGDPFALWERCVFPEDCAAAKDALSLALSGETAIDTEFRITLPNDEIRHLKSIGQVRRDASGTPRSIVGLNFDVTKRKDMELELVEAAQYDKLTGLANRAQFMERLEKAVARVGSGEQSLFAVLFLDFDRFKIVNDTLGHEAGDELLRQIARRLQRELRSTDAISDSLRGNVVSRFGGDEFLLLINDLKTPGDATRIAERLLNSLARSYDILGSEVHSTASIGIVTSEQSQSPAEDVLRNADVAMYEAKRAGRACSVVFNEAMHTRLTRHATIEAGLRRAIGTAEMYVLYQPIIELTTGRLVSAEALVRWNHPLLGSVSPAEFIPIAEETGLIIALDAWVLKQACRAMARWRVEEPQRAPDTVSVNLSRAELALGQPLLDQLRETLERVGLPPHCLQLEVTEREVMRNPEASRKLMQDLQSLGIKLAMDDFGTGTSSLGLLRDYPFNTIKIDRSFVHDLTSSADVLAVIHATITLVENLSMASLVEGVEDATQVAILQSLGCRYAQGYLFSHPVPADLLLDAVATRSGSFLAATA